jgi:hypothetical protein
MGYRIGDNMKLLLISLLLTFNVEASLPPTQSRGANESNYGTTFKFNWGALPITRSGTEITFGTLPVSGGGTGLTTLSQYSILSGSGTAVNEITPAASGSILFATDDFPAFRFLNNTDVVSALGYTPVISGTVVYSVAGIYPVSVTGTSSAPIVSLEYQPVASVSVTAPITITGTASSPTIGLQPSGVISGTYTKVGVDSFGTVTSGTLLVESDIPNLQTTKITSGTFGIIRGGTGLNTVGASSTVLTSNGTDLVYAPVFAAPLPIAVSSTSVSVTYPSYVNFLNVQAGSTITLLPAASYTQALTIKRSYGVGSNVLIQTSLGQLIDSVSASTSLVNYGEAVTLVPTVGGFVYADDNSRIRRFYGSYGGVSQFLQCATATCPLYSNSGAVSGVARPSQGNYRMETVPQTCRGAISCGITTANNTNQITVVLQNTASTTAVPFTTAIPTIGGDNTWGTFTCQCERW